DTYRELDHPLIDFLGILFHPGFEAARPRYIAQTRSVKGQLQSLTSTRQAFADHMMAKQSTSA
ncbi:MAG TPA: hypothetical protein VJR03_05355, partial [Nitrospira sp.]|nr:hypothetical protein [Nitrospira sp.]